MTTRVLLTVLATTVLTSVVVRADDDELKREAKEQYDQAQKAYQRGEYDKLVAATHPKVVELMGGKEKMSKVLADGRKKQQADGYEVKDVKIGTATNPVRAGSDIYITVPGTLEMKAPGGRLVTDCTTLGVSSDGGKTWKFVSAAVDRTQLLKLLPNLPKSLVLPKLTPPTFIKD